MKRIFRYVAIVVGVLLVAVLAILVARPQPVLVDVVYAEQGALQVTIDEDGLTRIKERYVVSTPLAGRLERISLEVGDVVVADTTVIARMQPTDPSLLDPRAVAQAKARVSAAERRLDAAQSELKKAESSAEFANAELDRAQSLSQTNVMSAADLDARQLEYRIRSEESRAAGFRVGIADYELDLEKAALLLTDPNADTKSPGDERMELSIKAPINGRVLRIYRESASVLDAGASLLEIGDPLDLEVVVDVLSVDAVRVDSGDRVVLENWGGESPLNGEVRVIEPAGFTKLSALGVEEQRVNVVIDLLDPPDVRSSLGDGFRVDARIIVWSSENVLRVPTSALFRVESDWGLFRVGRDGTAQLTKVQIDHNNGVEAEIVSGLDDGQTIVVHPSDSVSTGTLVQQRGGPL